ncbi:D-ribose transporter ATP-binding protein [Thermoclostridium stercorarium subsp. leptospartum DSM 9219]|uniref:D-ribose transporter ATP-binding protein n=2 Tax=Thermoclostridium stercorarium TaxID=1510 RepID=A0A1B1YI74_THEST|nr:sugar ABC transporter ATP-binding protein [Thermoclostridium stercorarium]ANX00479.1 D-ribose transporter ATP-binding protein [Thermoclostridium stercorarium subsp. leptospartum DSM 9219]
MSDYVLAMKGITKSFPGVKALDGVDFQLKYGETHVIMGENGAGKSTFIKIITGVHSLDEGEIYLHGNKVNIRTPRDSLDLGIAAIYQHSTGYPDLSVTENIFIGHEKISRHTKTILWNEMHEEAEKLLKMLGADFDPRVRLGALSVAQQQIVEIAKALSTNAKIIIMDEPTAALTKRESEQLYKIVEQLKKRGTSIIFISHRFEDMYRLADRVTVLRDGKYIGTWNRDEINTNDIIVAMVGREINQIFPPKKTVIGEELFRVENLSKTGYFKDISFSVHKGEIVGLTGLVGAGRSEVCQAIFGITHLDSGSVYIEGKEVKITSPLQAMELGIGYLPEDRQKQGLILGWDIEKNITLPTLDKYANKGWLNPEQEKEVAEEYARKLKVKANDVSVPVSSLSGGNQQKVIIAKLLATNLKVIILDEPTKGVDVGAKVAIYEIINSLAEQGYGIVMVSSEMPEILGMCDKIVVMREGRITAVFDRKEATSEKILEASVSTKAG